MFFTVVLFHANYALYAENIGNISGSVRESESNTPLAAIVKLYTNDTVLIKGTECSSEGKFQLDALPYGTYKLEVSLMEYSTMTIEGIVINADNPAKTIDTLHLKKNNIATDEILVEGTKNILSLTGDKKVFDVNQSITTKGGNALDVLKKVPMVDVDMDDNVSLRGSKNVKILIDDKPLKFASLKQVPADGIEKVEIITNPSAKYEAEGVTGIINLVMKQSKELGYTGTINLGTGYKDRYNGSVNINFKKGKWSLFGSTYLGSTANFSFSEAGTIDYSNPVSHLISLGKGQNSSKYFFSLGGAEYEFIKGNTLGIEANIYAGGWKNSITTKDDFLNSNLNLESYNMLYNKMSGMWQGYTLNLYYTGKLDEKGKELSADFTFSRNRNGINNNLNREDFDGSGNFTSINPFLQYDQTNNKTYNLNAQVDYVHPFNDVSKLEAGYKGIFRRNDNDFAVDSMDYALSGYVRNTGNSNHFKLDENINAVYGVFSSAVAGFSYKLGLRLEQTNTKGELYTGGQNFQKSYLDYFPTISISRKFGDIHQLQLSYSRRITRPGVWRLNPFVNKNDPKIYWKGNPDLNPEFTDAYELSYSLFTPVISITPLLFFRQTHDVISRNFYLTDSNIFVSTFRNAKGSKAYGMDLILSSRALPWLNLNGTLSLYNTKFDEEPIEDYASEEGFSWKGNIRASLSLGTLFNVEMYYNYTGKKINAQSSSIPMQNFDIGISRKFMNDKLSVNCKAIDIFNTREYGEDINSSQYKAIYRETYDSRTFSVNLSYKFGNTDEYYQKKKKVRQNENETNDQQENNSGR